MRFVTKLMKMNLEARSVGIQREQLLLKGQSGALDGEMYIRPKELVDIIRLGLNAQVILFLIFFPFYYLVDYLRESDGDAHQRIYSLARATALVLATVLLVASFPHLARFPLQSALLLGSFAGLCLVAYFGGRVSALFYAFVLLGVVSYYLVAHQLGMPEQLFPVLAVPVLVVVYLAAGHLGGSRYADLSQPLYNAAYLITLFFTVYLAWNVSTYVNSVPWEAALPLLAFAALFLGRYVRTRGLRHQYPALLFLVAGYLFYLRSLAPLYEAYYGVWLGALGVLLALVGSYQRRTKDLAHAEPLCVSAMLLPMAGLAFSLRDQSAFLPTLLTLSVAAYIVSRAITARGPERYTHEWWLATVAFTLAHLAAVVIAFGLFDFRPSAGALISALGLAVLYHQIAAERGPVLIQSRNVYLHVATFFLTTFSLLVLTTFNPFNHMQFNAPLLLVPSLGVVAYAYLREGKGQLREATSLYESSYFLLAAALALPILTRSYSASFSSIVAVGFLVLYFVFAAVSRNEGLLYSPVVVGAFLYYNLLSALGLPSAANAALFGVVGCAFAALALRMNDTTRPVGRIMYFGWFLFSALSVLAVAGVLPLVIYALTFWAVFYLLGARFVRADADSPAFLRNPLRGLRNVVELAGTLAGLAGLSLLALHQDPIVALVVTAALAAAYLAAYLLSRQHLYLYPACFLAAAAYILALKPFATYDNGLLFMLPLLAVLYGLGHYLWRREERSLSLPLVLAGHAGALGAVGLVVLNQHLVTFPPLVVGGLLLYAAADVALLHQEGQRWYAVPGLVFLAFAVYFATAMGGPLLLPTRLAVVAPLGLLYAGIAAALKRQGRESLVEPFLVAALVISLGVDTATFLVGGAAEAQIAVLIGAAAFVAVYLLLLRQELIYLIVLSLGFLAYHFMLASVDFFSRELVDDFAVGLLVCSVIFLVPPTLRAFGYRKPLGELVLERRGWAFALMLPVFFAVPVVAAQFTINTSSNPTFCSSCHSMKSFYTTWQQSAHAQKAQPPVGCDSCHYPPGGADVLLKGRFTGLLMTLDEVGGFQPSKFHARVTDDNCLQCHQKEKLDKWITFKGIRFNHAPMINQPVRGITLNCTTCHARTTDSTNHFEVSVTTCYYCHLLGRTTPQGTAVGTCYTCHDSSVQTQVGAGFVTVGGASGATVEQTRCLSCHTNSDKIDDVNLMHEAHVNNVKVFRGRKVECFECHGEIKHGNLGSQAP